MSKIRIILPLLLTALLLVSCRPQPSPPPEEATATSTAKPALPTVEQGDFEASAPANCTVVSLQPTPNPTEAAVFPPVSESDWVQGSPEATVTIIEYSEFQCPYCAQFAPVLKQLLEDYPDDVRLVYRHFPLSFHDKAFLAAQAAEAAGMQGKFFEAKTFIFEQRPTWIELSPQEFETWIVDQAETLGLDRQQFAEDFASPEIKARVQFALDEAQRIGIPGTPFVLINGRTYQGPRDYHNLAAVINLLKLEEHQFSECPEMTLDLSKQYIATLKTEKGDIVLELFAKQAPMTVNSFVFLARNGWFDGVIFHRVLPGFVAQSGDPSGTGYGGPGYAFSLEVTPELRFDKGGVLGMANAGPDSNGSQFFITYAPQPNLDGKYTVFGQIVAGMDVLEKLQERDPSKGGELPAGDRILGVIIEEK